MASPIFPHKSGGAEMLHRTRSPLRNIGIARKMLSTVDNKIISDNWGASIGGFNEGACTDVIE